MNLLKHLLVLPIQSFNFVCVESEIGNKKKNFSLQRRKQNKDDGNSAVNTISVVDNQNIYTVYHDNVRRKYMEVKGRKRKLKRKISEYVTSFTVHGLTRIVTGNKPEKIVWSVVVMAALAVTVYITQGYIAKYCAHGIYLDAYSSIDEKAYHPTITFCLGDFLRMYKGFYCGNPVFMHPDSQSSCMNDTFKSHLPYKKRSDALWSNGIFHVTNCFSNVNCVSDEFFRSSINTHGACVSWNWNKTLYQIYNKAIIEFEIENEVFTKFSHDPLIYTIVHDYKLNGEFLNHQIEIIPGQIYYLQIDKKTTKRLPHPFPSNCTSERPTDVFPGEYNRRSCIITAFDIETYKKCGGIRDFALSHIPDNIKTIYKQNKTISDMTICFLEDDIEDSRPNCPVPCVEINYDVNSFVIPMKSESSVTSSKYSIHIGYQTPDTFQIYEERELYPWDKLVSEFGGLLGLFIGASVLSLIEICICVLLCFMKSCVKN